MDQINAIVDNVEVFGEGCNLGPGLVSNTPKRPDTTVERNAMVAGVQDEAAANDKHGQPDTVGPDAVIVDDYRTIEPAVFRNILGHFPTGVVAVTALDADGNPVGMAVGSFTSVSLEPPLVAFLPDKSSSTFPKILAAGRFCANVLGSQQQPVCRSLSRRGTDKFADVEWTAAPSGMPRITGSLAWIDCEIDAVHDAGDHHIVVGRVRHLELDSPESPLIFFQGGYGGFDASTPQI